MLTTYPTNSRSAGGAGQARQNAFDSNILDLTSPPTVQYRQSVQSVLSVQQLPGTDSQ